MGWLGSTFGTWVARVVWQTWARMVSHRKGSKSPPPKNMAVFPNRSVPEIQIGGLRKNEKSMCFSVFEKRSVFGKWTTTVPFKRSGQLRYRLFLTVFLKSVVFPMYFDKWTTTVPFVSVCEFSKSEGSGNQMRKTLTAVIYQQSFFFEIGGLRKYFRSVGLCGEEMKCSIREARIP